MNGTASGTTGGPVGGPGRAVDDAGAAARSTASLLASRVVVAALGWGGGILVARNLSQHDFGQFAFVFGLLGLLSVVTDLGVGRVVIGRLVDGAQDADRVASSFIALRVLLGLVGYAVAVAFVVLAGYPREVVTATAVAGLVVVVATPSHALTVLFQSRMRLTVVAATQAVGQVVQLGLTVLAVLVAPVLVVLVLPAVLNEALQLVLKARAVRRGVAGAPPSRRVEVRRWGGMLAEALPVSIGLALADLGYRVDVVLLSRLDTFTSVGLYSVGYKFADVLGLVGVAVLAPVLPRLVAVWPARPEELRERVRSAALVLALLGALAVAGFWVAAQPLVGLMYGARFAPAAGAAQLLVLSAALGMLTQLGLTVLLAAGRHRVYPWVGLAGLTLNVGVNLWAIPRFSYHGAAAVTLATEVVAGVLLWLLASRSLRVAGLLPLGRLAGLAAAVAVSVLLGHLMLAVAPWPLAVVVSLAVTVAAARLLRLPGVTDPRAALVLLRGRRRSAVEEDM